MLTLPATRAQAASIGASHFYNGRPCARGHDAPRYTKGGACAMCVRDRNARTNGRGVPRQEFRPTKGEPGTGLTYVPDAPCKRGHKLRWVTTRNCVECDAAARIRHKEAIRYSRIKKEYGLSKHAHADLVGAQGGGCAICGHQPTDSFKLHVDHCHSTGRVRGLLCSKCNQAIGLFNESPEIMRAALRYLGHD
jgi:hypothetical protein